MTCSYMSFILWLSLFRSRVSHLLATLHIFKGNTEQEISNITVYLIAITFLICSPSTELSNYKITCPFHNQPHLFLHISTLSFLLKELDIKTISCKSHCNYFYYLHRTRLEVISRADRCWNWEFRVHNINPHNIWYFWEYFLYTSIFS